MLNVTLTIGHNVKGIPTLNTRLVTMAATTIMGACGATITKCDGIWMGESESSTRIDIACNLKEEHVKARVSKLSSYLMQDAIMCETRIADIEFLG